MESNTPDNPVPREIRALLSDQRLILRETQRAVTPFGGVAVFLSFLGKIDLVGKVRQHMPIRWKSPNHIDPTATFTAFLMSVLVGARRFAHASLLRGDRALHALLGLERFPTDDTIRNLFRRFGMGQVQRLFEPLTEWQMERLPQLADRRSSAPSSSDGAQYECVRPDAHPGEPLGEGRIWGQEFQQPGGKRTWSWVASKETAHERTRHGSR